MWTIKDDSQAAIIGQELVLNYSFLVDWITVMHSLFSGLTKQALNKLQLGVLQPDF